MSQTDTLFRANAPCLTFAATTAAPTAKRLPKAGTTLRIVNRSSVEAFFAVSDDMAIPAVATLPVDGSTVSSYAGPGCDFTVTLSGDSQKWVSAITSAGAASLLFYIDEGC